MQLYLETNETYLDAIDIESIITDFNNLSKLNKIPNKILKIIENNNSINLNERKSNKKRKTKYIETNESEIETKSNDEI